MLTLFIDPLNRYQHMQNLQLNTSFFAHAIQLIRSARHKINREINTTMVQTYYEIGRMIVDNEQQGHDRAAYGKQLLINLSEVLTAEFGAGFSETNLRQMRKFYLTYAIQQTLSAEFGNTAAERDTAQKELNKSNENPIQQTPLSAEFEKSASKTEFEQKNLAENDKNRIQQTLSAEFENTVTERDAAQNTLDKNDENRIQQTVSAEFKLSWSHYLKLMRIDNEHERRFYEIESVKNNWSLREFSRNYDSSLFTRLAMSRDKEKVMELAQHGHTIEKAGDLIKDPYILEFLGLENLPAYSESDLEERIIDKLGQFLMELGNGFTFVSRQKRITFDERHFHIDLVFYNRLLRSFVLIDLKIGEIKHQDIGQMQMYVNYYDRKIKLKEENKTIGIILCQNKSEALVRYTLPEDNDQIFASIYETILPRPEEFMSIITAGMR